MPCLPDMEETSESWCAVSQLNWPFPFPGKASREPRKLYPLRYFLFPLLSNRNLREDTGNIRRIDISILIHRTRLTFYNDLHEMHGSVTSHTGYRHHTSMSVLKTHMQNAGPTFDKSLRN
ncbi:hypothetical protein K491DRAFT_349927 [Lophiostoma macrostomum CBS 122681]|uniref:Uncharacterized protein n=1 Tax=Lophiostoma macrostomum CBS 122681 TaxID=1314788 RepID=A0A6A6TEN0_9PLEO|nr:hypothetical protein K491DRAFT_349927 [Lophiostoma macrostomum CBS 122681]